MRSALSLLAAALTLVLGPAAAGDGPVPGRALAPGISVVEDSLDGAPVHLVLASPAAASWRVLRPAAPARALRAEDLPAGAPVVAAWNGGFFDPELRPLGLLVEGGRLIEPLRRADWGVFWIDRSGRGFLAHRRSFDWSARKDAVDFAVECGPRVLVEGRPVQVKPGAARRTILGIREDGTLLVAVFPRPVELREAGLWLRDRWGVRDALNLDGGSSTQLALQEQGRWTSLAAGIPVPVLLGLAPRAGDGEELR